MKLLRKNVGQSLLENLLLTAVVAVVAIVALSKADGGGHFFAKAQNAAKEYFYQGVRGISAGDYDPNGRPNPQPVPGGWCAWGACVNGVQERECACPRPAFGGDNCSGGAQFMSCGGVGSGCPAGSGKVYLPGGGCGCPVGTIDRDGVCVGCAPDCNGKNCGSDGCGGVCPPGCFHKDTCVNGVCTACVPNCTGRSCGPDGCDGFCPPGCPPGTGCDGKGECTIPCIADCGTRVCGSNGCGGSCGTCLTGTCSAGQCVTLCTPDCGSRVCGSDGCGGECGPCDGGVCCTTGGGASPCVIGTCVPTDFCCPPGRLCGPDLCGEGTCGGCVGNTCGECSDTAVCSGTGGTGASECVEAPEACRAEVDPDPYDYETNQKRPTYSWVLISTTECCPALPQYYYECRATGTEFIRKTCPSETSKGGVVSNPCVSGMTCMSDCSGSGYNPSTVCPPTCP